MRNWDLNVRSLELEEAEGQGLEETPAASRHMEVVSEFSWG